MAQRNPYKTGQIRQLEEKNTDLLSLYQERKDKATSALITPMQKFQRYYSVYRQSFDTRRFSAFKNFVQMHFVFAAIESVVSKKVQALFSSWPIIDFMASSSDDADIANKNAVLVSTQIKAFRGFYKLLLFFLHAEIYGTAVARLGWKHQGNMQKVRVPTPNGGEQWMKGYVTTFDGPDLDIINLENFWPEAGRQTISDCKYAFHQYFLDADDLRAGRDSGEYIRSAVDQALQGGGIDAPGNDGPLALNTNFYRNLMDNDFRQGDKYQKRIQCVDMVGEVPDEFVTDGYKMRLITVANDRFIIKNDPFPFHHGRLDKVFFVYSPVPDPHYFHGIGKAEVMEKMQYLINRYASQKADAMDTALDPMWLINELAGGDMQNINTRSGKVIKFSGPVTEENIRPFSADLRGIPLAQNEIQQYWDAMQIASGEFQDVGMGGEGPNRETATSIQTRSARALGRLGMEIRNAEETFIEPVAESIRDLNRQFLRLPQQVATIGSSAIVNPYTGLPLKQEPLIITHFDVAMDYKAQAVAGSMMLSKSQRQGSLMQMTQLLATTPVARALNWYAWVFYVMKNFDVPNPSQFFVQEMNQLNEMAAEQTTDPNAQVNMAAQRGGPEGGFPPEVLQMIMGGQAQ